MDRKAKRTVSYSDLIDYILEDYDIDYLPYLDCPAKDLADNVSMVFCSTKCWILCWKFRRFHFITKKCDEVSCSHSNPCPECVGKIEDFKEIICQIRAIFYKRQRNQSVNRKVKEFIYFSENFVEEIRQES